MIAQLLCCFLPIQYSLDKQREVSIGTTVVPIIFAIRTTVDITMHERTENSNWYLQSICLTRLQIFFVVRITAAIRTTKKI